MVDLKLILRQHPKCLSSRASFKAVLMDTYPDEKRTVNILTIMFECGLVQKIKSKSVLEDNDFRAMLLQLENDYGIISKYSGESIRIWADALGVAVQARSEQPSSPVTHEPIIHKPIIDSAVIEGCKSDYETEVLKSGTLKITRFIGFDEKEITIPNQLGGKAITVVGESAFAKCTGIEKVMIPEGITTIENGAFFGCESLKTVLLPTTLKWLGNKPKMSTPTYSWQSPTEMAHDGVFEGTAIRSIDLPIGLTFLGKKAFQSCQHLTHIDLPNGIKMIPESCFSGCSALKTIALPDNLSAIRAFAFSNAGLEQIDIPPSCGEIESKAFNGCEHLSQILLHEGLTKIGDSAFENCKGLCAITIPKSVTEIGKQVFDITGWYQPYDRRYNGWSTREKSKDLIISCYAGSYGLYYARTEGYQIKNAAK